MDSSILQMAKTRDSLVFNKPLICRSTKPNQLKKLLDEIEKSTKRFKLVSNCLITKSSTSTPSQEEIENLTEFNSLSDQLEREIFISGLHTNLLSLYDGEYFSTDVTIEQMKQNLKSIIGEIDPKEEEKLLISEFNSMGRRQEWNETFTAYLARLVSKASELTNTTYADKLVEMQFEKNLREMDLEALAMISAGSTDTKTGVDLSKHQAQLLDKMLLHKKKEVKVNSLQTDILALDGKLTEFKTQMMEQSDARFEQFLSRMDQKLQDLTVNDTKPESAQPKTTNTVKAKPNKTKPKKTKRKFDPNEWCRECGLRGHKEADCKPRPDLQCILCMKFGHTAAAKNHHGLEPKN